jgi:small-conductance mechanosensitive channel
VIQLESVTGVVESVDMLSVKIRTFDNRLVRVPNETLIKANIVNVTHWPERRLDVSLTLPYGSDIALAETILRRTAADLPEALPSPEPFFLVDSLGPNGISVLFGVWFKKDDFMALKNAFLPLVLSRLEARRMRPAAQVLALQSPLPAPRSRAEGEPKRRP